MSINKSVFNFVEGDRLKCNLDLSLPQKYVPNSASGVVSITGNSSHEIIVTTCFVIMQIK